ncbi:hypothetical protein [Mucilaginibacter pedocola]|uniref:Uncharacterized protein n=1 Tax=Mucilaginibacter pedocola TaxID=1792845 RepID=A0A1S9PG37_9SPHI|nr:hypothetical protein [Mucilaginibacter pedocola]OOQ59847.1 hypothetical protein BC343_06800 [Mucilaginibacter pedocola]
MNAEKIYFENQFCNETECLPLADAIRASLSIADYYQPECFVLKVKKWGEYHVKAYYRVNGLLYYATAKMDRSGNITEKRLNVQNLNGTVLKIAV